MSVTFNNMKTKEKETVSFDKVQKKASVSAKSGRTTYMFKAVGKDGTKMNTITGKVAFDAADCELIS